MSLKEITENHLLLVQLLKKVLNPWRKFTIAIDGVDHSGKSTLARFLAWQLEMPAIETDLYLSGSTMVPSYHWKKLSLLVQSRHRLNRPVIIEGVFVKKILEQLKVKPDFSIYVECYAYTGSEEWQEEFARYAIQYSPRDTAQFLFVNPGSEGS
ncbi:hypothetical protein [Candidatus Nitrospira allomarina]|uniref:Uncharacterized protein n=1 Tax=Candidatus Nitrospira allomarina TaxID=3020900 RepID=A0AA96GG12_9BACT|nr:hypothetical protein [Candidatus Nitrospira allomarina]WNM57889.1 hypothetical protein PP769_18245 [Candidatus Nitrospira allomarina]